MQLEGTLFPTTVVPTEAAGGAEGPPAAAVARPHPLPRPARVTPDIRRFSHSRLVAIAAVLALVIGGMGAILGGPFNPRSTPEPSSIPAASFGTVEASPEPVAEMWTVAAPSRVENGMEDRPPVVSNGLAFRTFAAGSGIPMQAVDLNAERVLWETAPRIAPDLIAPTGDLLLVAGGNGKSSGFRYELVALDGRTGVERWSEALPSKPVGLKVLGDQIIVLGSDNLLESFDLQTQDVRWQVDLSRFVDSMNESEGLNRFTDSPDGRLAIADGVIGALLNNGRLVAVDATDGRLKWSDERRSIGWTRVAVVDGQFVVIAFGKDTLPYDPEAKPLPFAPFDPKIDPCLLTLQNRSSSEAETPPGSGETVDSFDPETGDSAWGVIAQESYSMTPTNDSRLIVEIGPGWEAIIANNDKDFTCSIDAAAGAVSETTANDLATFVCADTETGELHGLGATPSGIPIWIAHVDSDQAVTLPYLDLDLMQVGGLRYVREADDLILITMQNGTLIGLPKDAPRWSPTDASTPEPDAVATADSGWMVTAPEDAARIGELGSVHEIANGHIFRAFSKNTGGGLIQATGADNGAELWLADTASVATLMGSSGDLLLAALPIYGSGTSQITAIDMATGQERWTTTLSDMPIAMLVNGEQLLVLGIEDQLEAIDIATGRVNYAVDIRGDAATVSPVLSVDIDAYVDRMAIDEQTLYVSLGDGSVVAVDAATGAGKWWVLRPTPGQVQVYVVDGVLITVDKGDLDAISARIEVQADVARSGTPVAEESMPNLGSVSCFDQSTAATPVAVSAGTPTPVELTTVIRGLDTSTGKMAWSMELPEPSGGVGVNDVGFHYFVVGRASSSEADLEFALCVADPRTGAVRQIVDLEDLAGTTYLVNRSPDTTPTSIGIVLPDARTFFVPIDLDPDLSAPIITIDETTFGDGWWWSEVYDGAIYFALIDGSLVKIPIPAE